MRSALSIFVAMLLLTPAIDLAYADRLQSWIDDLQSANTATKLSAIKGLGESGDIRAVPPLVEALGDERDVVRQHAVEALQHLVIVLDDVYSIVKRWVQSLINKLRLRPADEAITVEQPMAHRLVALLGMVGQARSAAWEGCV
jgi:HEAT repeat protein